jgi:hypothetical protein
MDFHGSPRQMALAIANSGSLLLPFCHRLLWRGIGNKTIRVKWSELRRLSSAIEKWRAAMGGGPMKITLQVDGYGIHHSI